MKVITLKQPWASLIMWSGKCVENRTWRPPDFIIGQRIAIHAGKSLDFKMDADARREYSLTVEQYAIRGAIIGTVVVTGFRLPYSQEPATELQREWWESEQYGWLLDDPQPLPKPIYCKGALGLWTIDDKILFGG